MTAAAHRYRDPTLEIGKSPGLSLEVAHPPAGMIHLELLFGTRTAGFGLFTRDYGLKRVRWSVGVGAIGKYHRYVAGAFFTPFAGVTVKPWTRCACSQESRHATPLIIAILFFAVGAVVTSWLLTGRRSPCRALRANTWSGAPPPVGGRCP